MMDGKDLKQTVRIELARISSSSSFPKEHSITTRDAALAVSET